MLIPSPDYIIVETTKEVFNSHVQGNAQDPITQRSMPVLVGKVYAIGDTQFSDSPVMGDGRSFSWARKPEEFPLTNGEEVVCQYWEHATQHEDKYLFIVSKSNILGVYRNRQEVEATLFDNAQPEVALAN
jgi:co-chaperonin GroES (HSP10)